MHILIKIEFDADMQRFVEDLVRNRTRRKDSGIVGTSKGFSPADLLMAEIEALQCNWPGPRVEEALRVAADLGLATTLQQLGKTLRHPLGPRMLLKIPNFGPGSLGELKSWYNDVVSNAKSD
jgi:hypothetical protein